jgi:hypothetical protein
MNRSLLNPFSIRLFDEFDVRSYRCEQGGIEVAVRCHYSASKSAQSTQTVTSTGAGGVAAGDNSASAGQGSLVVGSGGKYLEQGSSYIDLGGLTDSTITATSADPQIVQAALDTVNQFGKQLTDATSNQTAALAALATTVQTGNQNQQNNVVLWIVIAGIAALTGVVIFIFKRK